MIRQKTCLASQLLLGAILFAVTVTGAAQNDLKIQQGSIVSIEYTLRLQDGSVAASNVDQAPLVYEAGGKRVLPALDRALMGLSAGETMSLSLSPEKGYGVVRDDLLVEVDIVSLPVDSRQVGAVLVATNEQGIKQRARVREIKGNMAVLDYNHPFAGQRIHFSIRVIDVK